MKDTPRRCFGTHDDDLGCPKLRRLFQNKPFQCQNPTNAALVFVGLDANWDQHVQSDPNWGLVEQYLENGVSFWKRHHRHHPLLLMPRTEEGLPMPGAVEGKSYHDRLEKLLRMVNPDCEVRTKQFPSKVSFVELLGVPTYGKLTKAPGLFRKLLQSRQNLQHLKSNIIKPVFNCKRPKIVFLVGIGTLRTLLRLKKHEPMLNELDVNRQLPFPRQNDTEIRPLKWGNPNCQIYPMTHFSAAISNCHLKAVARIIRASKFP